MEEKLKVYFRGQNLKDVSIVTDITTLNDGNSSNHLNYKVTTPEGIFLARVVKPDNHLSYANLSDEYTILKLIEEYDIGPRAIHIDLEYFDSPLLIEEFMDGTSASNIQKAPEDLFNEIIALLTTTSNIDINFNKFPFKFTYTTYETNFKAWSIRMEEIKKALGSENPVVKECESIIKPATEILKKKDSLLRSSPREFVYNDVHRGNLFWLAKKHKAMFIDWQKVSFGDPSFMIALFARRFGEIWGMGNQEFAKKVLESYRGKKQINHLEELFYARVFERAASDMIWSMWSDIKKEGAIKNANLNENKYYGEVKRLMSGM